MEISVMYSDLKVVGQIHDKSDVWTILSECDIFLIWMVS